MLNKVVKLYLKLIGYLLLYIVVTIGALFLLEKIIGEEDTMYPYLILTAVYFLIDFFVIDPYLAKKSQKFAKSLQWLLLSVMLSFSIILFLYIKEYNRGYYHIKNASELNNSLHNVYYQIDNIKIDTSKLIDFSNLSSNYKGSKKLSYYAYYPLDASTNIKSIKKSVWACYQYQCYVKGGDNIEDSISISKIDSLKKLCSQHDIFATNIFLAEGQTKIDIGGKWLILKKIGLPESDIVILSAQFGSYKDRLYYYNLALPIISLILIIWLVASFFISYKELTEYYESKNI